jgi:Hydrazine synthase alpha subunit middle domain/F5/8 type C domain
MRPQTVVVATALLAALLPLAAGEDPPFRSDRPYEIVFPAQEARFVRLVIRAAGDGTQPCIDELEVYAGGGGPNLALADQGAKASASSCLGGYAQHAVAHLNDGLYGNEHSWIPATSGEEWAQIELAEAGRVARTVISRDRNRQYGDRVPTDFDVRLSLDGRDWTTVRQIKTSAISGAVPGNQTGPAPPIPAPPPPPKLGDDGKVTFAAAPADLTVPDRDERGLANLALAPGAKPQASSVYLDGQLPIHQIAHLNDGKAGNSYSWISKGEPSWAEIDLGDVYWVCKVAFGSDSSQRYGDRAATAFAVLTAERYDVESKAEVWKTVYRQEGGAPVNVRTEFRFRPVQARWVRIGIEAANQTEARIDEIEVYGQKGPIPAEKVGPLTESAGRAPGSMVEQLRYAFIGEEHAWLKTYGRADLDPSLVPYNGRVQEYPRHVPDDRLPLPPLASVPKLDGVLDDACWPEGSRGVVRVADPQDFDLGPLVAHAVWAGWRGEDLYLGIEADRLLSAHVAVVSGGDWQGGGVLALTEKGFAFNTYTAENGEVRLERSTPVRGGYDGSLRRFEVGLPLSLFPGCREHGIRIGLGMGGRHTNALGRPVTFVFAPLAVAEGGPCLGSTFHVRLTAPPGGPPARLSGNAPGLEGGISLAPGETKALAIAAGRGAVGPEYSLTIDDESGESYVLNLFRYDPLGRTLGLFSDLIDRLAAKGLDVPAERHDLARLTSAHERLSAKEPGSEAERKAFFEARLAKRRLFLREPDLAPIARLLFVKRQPFHPSHIYTDYTDAPFRPGGGVFVVDVPQREGRFEPDEAKVTKLFDAGGGIARDPAATFDLGRVYFGYRPRADGFYHIMAMGPDGSDLKQLTDGSFHDFYPCPLPDGDLAFISTRCTARVFCFRGASSVLFRMRPDGSGMRPLSFASLSEWAPSVMRDGRIVWTRWEYVDKGADFSQTLWSIRPDGTEADLVFGNDVIQPNGYACGREVPGTNEICCTLVSHFGDINGPIALLDPGQGRFNPQGIRSLTPEVPWPGMWPAVECFRDPVPIARDYFLCAHAPRDRFALYLIDRYGNRELLYADDTISCMAPTPFRVVPPPPALPDAVSPQIETARLVMLDVYQGLEPAVSRGRVRYIRVVEEARHDISEAPNRDHADFMKWYASPVDIVSGPFGWPTYVAKAPLGVVPVEEDGSASFTVPAGRQLYFQALDGDMNELQRMRSVLQMQPGETRTCVGCHEPRNTAPPAQQPLALRHPPRDLEPPSWGAGRFSYERVVQPVLDAKCISCHDGRSEAKVNLTGTLDGERVPASYRALISGGWVHFVDCGWNSGGCEKREPLTFGTLQSKLWPLLESGHYGVTLAADEKHRIKCWTDLNCPLWPDYIERSKR